MHACILGMLILQCKINKNRGQGELGIGTALCQEEDSAMAQPHIHHIYKCAYSRTTLRQPLEGAAVTKRVHLVTQLPSSQPQFSSTQHKTAYPGGWHTVCDIGHMHKWHLGTMLGPAAGHSPALKVQPPWRSSPTLATLEEGHSSKSKSNFCLVDYFRGRGAEMLLLQMIAPLPHVKSHVPGACSTLWG